MTAWAIVARRRWGWPSLGLASVGAVLTFVADPGAASALFGAMFVVFPGVGVFLQDRVPDNPIGGILLAVGALAGVGGIATGVELFASPETVAAGSSRWLLTWIFFPVIGLVSVPLLLLFPNGRLPSPRWRWALWTVPLFVVSASVGAAFFPWSIADGGPNPLAAPDRAAALRALQDLSGLPLLVGAVAGIAALGSRYRRGSVVERQQIKWFLAAAAVLPVAIAIGDEFREIQGVVVPIAFILFPLAIGLAISRHRLYDIDRIVSRTVTYGLVTSSLVAAYAGTVFVLRLLLPTGDQLAVVASTLAMAGLFHPLRRRVQQVVDRRFNRSRYDAATVAESFGLRLRTQNGLDEVESRLLDVAGTTLQPRSVSLWLQDRSR